MKKFCTIALLIICFIPFISRKNDYVDVTTVISVNSLCIDYDEEKQEIAVYFYVLNNYNVAQSELSSSNFDKLAYVTKIVGPNFAKIFEKFKKISNVFIHYNHLRTVILTNKFLNHDDNPKIFYDFIRNTTIIYPTFYIYTTDDKIEEIYQIETFSDISAYHTLLINPKSIKTYKLTTYMDFVKAYNISNYTLKIPRISSAEDTVTKQDQEIKTVIFDGYSIYQFNKPTITYLEKEMPYIHWLNEISNTVVKIGEYSLFIKDGNYHIKQKNGKITINYTLNATTTISHESFFDNSLYEYLKKTITDELQTLFNKTIADEIDIFNIKYYLNLDTINDVEFLVKLEIN